LIPLPGGLSPADNPGRGRPVASTERNASCCSCRAGKILIEFLTTAQMMRIALLFLILSVSGCHLTGGGTGWMFGEEPQACSEKPCGQSAGGDCRNAGNCPAGSECRTCSHHSRTSEILCKMTFGCFGKHPKYCRAHDNRLTRHDARKLAHRELSQTNTDCDVTCDFKKGYEQAFVDVSQGGWGEVPALPPAPYWTNCSRTPGGHLKAQDWFRGYSAGAVAAKAIYEPYNRVAASPYYQGSWERGTDNYGNDPYGQGPYGNVSPSGWNEPVPGY